MPPLGKLYILGKQNLTLITLSGVDAALNDDIGKVFCAHYSNMRANGPWIPASGEDFWDINLLIFTLSFWARGRVVNTSASNANLQYRRNSMTTRT